MKVGNAKVDYIEEIANVNKWAGLVAVGTTLLVGGFTGGALSILSGGIAI